MNKPTIAEMREAWREDTDAFVTIEDKADGAWRHGSEHTFIAKRLSDGTLWMVCYRITPSADYNDFRDGDLDDSAVTQVWSHQITTTVYLTKEPI